jgi:energy-coupling factor transporter ATP-binding protein EcfA2
MAESAAQADPIRLNPLYNDLVLFDMYMNSLDAVLEDPEIRAALDEFRLSPQTLRGGLAINARLVLGAARREFAAYEAARTVWQGRHAATATAAGTDLDDLRQMSRVLALAAAAAGAMLVVAAVASIAVWRWTEPLAWAGATMLVIAGLLQAFRMLLATRPGLRAFRGELPQGFGPEVAHARNALIAAVGQDEFMAQARTFINTRRQDRFGLAYSVGSISGLSEIYDITYQVPTSAAAELEALLTRLDGASIGVAGPRGSGKSTLIRGYCEEGPAREAELSVTGWRELLAEIDRPGAVSEDLRCVVAAPVDYAARDFVLHMFAVFCRAVIGRHDRQTLRPAGQNRLQAWLGIGISLLRTMGLVAGCCALPAVILMHWQHLLAGYFLIPAQVLFYIAVAVILLGDLKLVRETVRIAGYGRLRALRSSGQDLAQTARRHLARVRYLQTYTSGWSGTLSLPGGGQGQHSRAYTRAEQPLSYPEIVGEFRVFARDVAAELHRNGRRVYIGIDELDKIGGPENVERFLNEIKGIFGIPHLYFMVSVSDDALTAFERRGLPLRDAFDSSFDEIIHVGPLSYAESRRLLYRRVIGLSEPYIALCHCLSGGLARDLIRAARQVVSVGEMLTTNRPQIPDEAGGYLIDSPGTYKLARQKPLPENPALGAVCSAVVRNELRRKVRAVAHVANNSAPSQTYDLQSALYDIVRQLSPDAPTIKIVDMACQAAQGEPAAVTQLRIDFAAYAYYCATLQEVFTDNLSGEMMMKGTSASAEPGTFDALAGARNSFTLDTQLAWRSITRFRRAWSLDTREPIKSE